MPEKPSRSLSSVVSSERSAALGSPSSSVYECNTDLAPARSAISNGTRRGVGQLAGTDGDRGEIAPTAGSGVPHEVLEGGDHSTGPRDR